MTELVLDCSAVLAWFFEDERDPDALRLMDALADTRARVPAIWPFELANAALMAERRGRLKPDTIAEGFGAMEALDIVVEPAATVAGEALALARAHRLTVYDAAYLALAQRRGLPLATRDTHLRKAARAAGVILF